MGSEAEPQPIKFHLTGFKKFHNMPENPTEVVVGRLMDFMKDRALPLGATLASCTVLEVAGAGGLDFLMDLLGSVLTTYNFEPEGGQLEIETKNCPETQVLWIHFGANSGASKFQVEQCAVNEAKFRYPDEMGWQPSCLPIVADDGPCDVIRETKIPTASIVEELVKQGFDAAVSTDAGRFVCNYVYYQSLRHAANHGTKSLFVHVPPFTVIDLQTQMEFVYALLKVLASSAYK